MRYNRSPPSSPPPAPPPPSLPPPLKSGRLTLSKTEAAGISLPTPSYQKHTIEFNVGKSGREKRKLAKATTKLVQEQELEQEQVRPEAEADNQAPSTSQGKLAKAAPKLVQEQELEQEQVRPEAEADNQAPSTSSSSSFLPATAKPKQKSKLENAATLAQIDWKNINRVWLLLEKLQWRESIRPKQMLKRKTSTFICFILYSILKVK